jgi:hypothetical protein
MVHARQCESRSWQDGGEIDLSIAFWFARMLDELENRAWAERNAAALESHGREIARTGLAGREFERI